MIFDFTIGADGKLNEPAWSRLKDGKVEYGPDAYHGGLRGAVARAAI